MEVGGILCRLYFNRHVRDKPALDGGTRSKFKTYSEFISQVPPQHTIKYQQLFIEYCEYIELMEIIEAIGDMPRWIEYNIKIMGIGIEMAKLSGATIDDIITLKDEEASIKLMMTRLVS